MFFVASVASDFSLGPEGQGPVNLSPKGGSPLHVINEKRVAYLDYTGSGNETGRHTRSGGPITIMLMSSGKTDAAVVRLFGYAIMVPVSESELADQLLAAPASDLYQLWLRRASLRVRRPTRTLAARAPVQAAGVASLTPQTRRGGV